MILFVPNTAILYEGGRHYLPRPDADFLKGLSDDGHEVIVMGFVTNKDDPFVDSSLDDIAGVAVFNLGRHFRYWGRARKLGFYLVGAMRVFHLLRSTRGFVYLYYPGYMATLIGLYCSITGRAYAMYVRGIWKRGGLAGRLSARLFRDARFVFTTGLGFKQLIAPVNAATEPVFPMTTFTPGTESMGDRSGRPVRELLFVGHARKNKGVLDCIRAVKLLKDDGLEMRLSIVGGGDRVDRDAIAAVCDENKLDGRSVIYCGHVSDRETLAEYFRRADAFLYPSYYPEGFPRVVYEAMIFGLPIVCTVLPGMKGFMKDNVNCIEVEPRAPSQIAAALRRINDDPRLAERLGRTARATVTDYFDQFEIRGHVNQFRDRLMREEQNGNT